MCFNDCACTEKKNKRKKNLISKVNIILLEILPRYYVYLATGYEEKDFTVLIKIFNEIQSRRVIII
jgi:hypothetical protein